MTKRLLNISFEGRKTEINVTGFERMGQVRRAVKEEFANALAQVDAANIQVSDQEGTLIDDLDEISDSYFQKVKNGGLCLAVSILPAVGVVSSTNGQMANYLERWFWHRWIFFNLVLIGFPVIVFISISSTFNSSAAAFASFIFSLPSSAAVTWNFKIFPILESGWRRCITTAKTWLVKRHGVSVDSPYSDCAFIGSGCKSGYQYFSRSIIWCLV